MRSDFSYYIFYFSVVRFFVYSCSKIIRNIFFVSILVLDAILGVSNAFAAVSGDNSKVVTVGYFASKNFQEGSSDSVVKSGYGYEYLQRVSDYTGWEYKYVYGDWAHIYDMFLRGEVDVVAGLAYREDRVDLMEYPDYSIDVDHHYIFVKRLENMLDETKLESLNGKRIGCPRYSNLTYGLKKWAGRRNLQLKYVYYDDIDELPLALERGDVDGITGSDKNIDHRMNVKPLVLYAAPKSYICVRKGATRLLQELNEALANIINNDFETIENLKERYYSVKPLSVMISPIESEWLSKHNELVIAYPPDYMPYSAKNSEGHITGALKEVMDLWLEKMNLADKLTIRYKDVPDYKSAVELLHRGEVDVIFPQPMSQWHAEQFRITFTSRMMEIPISVVIKDEFSESTFKKIAMLAKPVQSLLIQEKFPDSELLLLDDAEKCLKAVVDGRASSAVMTSFRVNPFMRNAEYNQLKVLPLGSDAYYALGVRKGNHALLSLLNRGLNLIDHSAISNIMYGYVEYKGPYTLSTFIHDNLLFTVVGTILVASLIIVILILYVSGMKKAQRETQGQVEVSEALSLDYPYAVMVDIEKGCSYTIKKEGKVLKEKDRTYHESYDAAWKYFTSRHIREEDRDEVLRSSSLDVVLENLQKSPEYICTYRAEWNGLEHYTQTSFTKIFSSHLGKYVLIVGCKTVDEIVAKERERQELMANALAVAEHSSQSKTIFLNNMSHDIRTPMNAIIGFTNLAKSHINDTEALKGYLNKISISSGHLLSLINNVLDMSRIESGKVKLAEERVHLPSMIREVQDIVQNTAQSKGVSISFFDALSNEVVLADDLKLKQVLLNIVGNAIKFTHPGGKVTLSVVERDGAPEGYANYQFTIADTGIGMSQNFMDHIFEPFSREKTSTVSGIQGTGLGMAISKNIIDMMGGTIVVDSTVNVGTKITITVALKFGDSTTRNTAHGMVGQDSASDLHKEHFADFSGKKVLLVEDNPLNQEIAIAILEELGFAVDVASDGLAAVEKVKNEAAGTYNVVLMDIQMPNMDGYEATREIRKISDSAKSLIPIVALTANAFEEDRHKAYEAGMNGHVSKPISVPELMEKLSKLV